jgi:hypothetical protein
VSADAVLRQAFQRSVDLPLLGRITMRQPSLTERVNSDNDTRSVLNTPPDTGAAAADASNGE